MSIWQTKQWGKMLLANKQADKVFDIGGIQVEKRSLGFGFFGLFIVGLDYTLSGIEDNSEEVEEFLADLAIKENAVFIQVEILNYTGELKNKFFNLRLMDFGFYKKFLIEYTAIIDLTKTEDEILSGMKQKGRYNIKLARKKGVKIIEVEKTKENTELFYNLMIETTSRDNFSGHSLEYYNIFLVLIESSKLLLAHIDGVVIAGGIFIYEGDTAIYYYGASTSKKEYRNLMAPYLVQWEAIQIAKKNGNKLFDFLGVAPEGIKNHELSGVTDFKAKFTKTMPKVSESYIYIRKPFIFKILKLKIKIKKILNIIKEKIKEIKNKKKNITRKNNPDKK